MNAAQLCLTYVWLHVATQMATPIGKESKPALLFFFFNADSYRSLYTW